MTFLELVQRLATECGVPVSNITTTVNQTGEAGRLVNWTNAAWLAIQNKHKDWDWMRRSTSWTTINQQPTYTTAECGITAGTFGAWERNTFRCYDTSAGVGSEQYLRYISYDEWRDRYKFGAIQLTYTRPMEMSITPDKGIALGPFPISGYTIRGDYFLAPSNMSGDSDEPALPEYWQLAIVWRAMMFYGAFESAPEVFSMGQREFNAAMTQIESDRLREVVFAGPLA